MKRNRRAHVYPILVGALALTSGIAIALGEGSDGFWADHPFLGGMATGALTLGFTILVLERYLVRRENRRWQRVADVAYRGLARESRGVFGGLAALWCELDHQIGSSYDDPGWTTHKLTPEGEIREIPAGKSDLAALHDPSLPSAEHEVVSLLPETRLRRLLENREWCKWAASFLHELIDRNRNSVAAWAPLMMNAEEPRDLLDAFASLNDDLFSLNVALEDRARRAGESSRSIDDVVHSWKVVDCKARLLTNELWRLAGEGHYAVVVPDALGNIEMHRIFARPGLIEGWSPASRGVASEASREA